MNYRMGGERADAFDGNTEIVLVDDFVDVLDDIEEKVNQALDKIKNIKGIDSIEECREILEKLSSELY